MPDSREVTVPDIGDFEGVPVIEILVSAGDEVTAEQPLVTLESDKATMDVPAPFAGRIAELKVSVGDEVSEGSVLMTVEASEGAGGEDEGADAEEPSANGDEARRRRRWQRRRRGRGGTRGRPAGRRRSAPPPPNVVKPDIVSGKATLGGTGPGTGPCTPVPRCGGWLGSWGWGSRVSRAPAARGGSPRMM